MEIGDIVHILTNTTISFNDDLHIKGMIGSITKIEKDSVEVLIDRHTLRFDKNRIKNRLVIEAGGDNENTQV